MPHEVERGGGIVPSIPTLRSDLERFEQPGFLTEAGQRDRRAVAQHQYEMRQIVRDTERRALQRASELYDALVTEAAEDLLMTDAKMRIQQQHSLSRLLAGEDPVLQAEFAVLDATRSQKRRERLLGFGR